jgi:hypothetical protein
VDWDTEAAKGTRQAQSHRNIRARDDDWDHLVGCGMPSLIGLRKRHVVDSSDVDDSPQDGSNLITLKRLSSIFRNRRMVIFSTRF